MVTLWRHGAKIIQTLRQDMGRRITGLKQLTSKLYPGFISWLSNTKLQAGAADFRLMDRSVVPFVTECGDKNLFLRGLLPWSGMKAPTLPCTPHERLYGTSPYTLRKMCKLAAADIVGYSIRLLYLSLGHGLIAICLPLLYVLYVIAVPLTGQGVSVGWPSLMAGSLGIGGIQLFVRGIIGIDLGDLLDSLNKRLSYVITETPLYSPL